MSNTLMSSLRVKALRSLMIPMFAILVFALTIFIFKGLRETYAVFVGGLVWVIPNIYFAWKIFAVRKHAEIVKTFYRAEITKLFLSAALFVLAIKFLSLSAPIILLTFLLAQFLFWIMLLLISGLNV